MELDRERLHVDFPDAEKGYVAAFSNLAGLLQPGFGDPTTSLHWAGFDIDLAGGIPPFLWEIEPKPAGGGDASIDLSLAQGVVRLTLADQRRGDPFVAPRAIATCNGTTLIRPTGQSGFELDFHAERTVTVPFDGSLADAETLGGRLATITGPPRLLWTGGRTLLPKDLDDLEQLASSAKQPLASALNELIASCTLATPFASNFSGKHPDLSAEPDLRNLLAYDDPTTPKQVRWVVPWMTPEAQTRISVIANDVQWDTSFRQALTQLVSLVALQPKFVYNAVLGSTGFDESIAWNAVDLVYDALGTADLTRNRTGAAAPDLFSTTSVPHGTPVLDRLYQDVPFVLWGPTPLDDGWAELPFFNLTEDVYLRILAPPGPDLDPPLISGAATFGTTTPELMIVQDDEQKWDVTLLDADVITAQSKFVPSGSVWTLSTLEARFWGPELQMNGWLWLSTVAPSTEDSVPDFGPWLTSLSSIELYSPRRRELFPCPFLVRFERGGFARSLQDIAPKPSDVKRTYAYPIAGGSTYQYRDCDRLLPPEQGASPVFGTLLSKLAPFLPGGTPPVYPPLLWRRHPSLPAIQTLPLTQSRTPPNYPSPSRQLVPFELPLKPSSIVPGTWRFDVSPPTGSSGAGAWPVVLDPKSAAGSFDIIAFADEWSAEPVVGLAYLSIPGLAGYPAKQDAPGVVADAFLPLALAHGLPANDEIHALAELPKAPNDNADAVQSLPPAPTILARETYAARWIDLAELAYRAAADGEPALTTDTGATLAARALIEPYPWNLSSAALEDTKYPGRFELHAAATGSTGLSLSHDAALAGFDGWFRVNSGALERFIPPDSKADPAGFAAFEAARGTSTAIAISGGAMAAVGDGTSLRDQRGLIRFATTAGAIVPGEGTNDSPWRILRTAVSLETSPGTTLDRTLATSLGAATLSLDQFGAWSFWFRDLPLSGKPDSATTYARSDTGDPLFREDVNDPTALGRNYGFRAGYEWRLFDSSAAAKDGVPRLGFLICHPLTLESLVFDTDGTGKPLDTVKSLELIVRLQLPLPGLPVEDVQSSNAARLVFDRRAGKGLRLEEIHIAVTNTTSTTIPAELIWPLSSAVSAPRLRMVDRGTSDPGIAYQAATTGSPATLTIKQPTVDLPVLDTIWSPRLMDTLTITSTGPSGPITWKATAPSDASTFVESVTVTIDGSAPAAHALALSVVHRWGRRPSASEPDPPIGVMLRQTICVLPDVPNTPPAHAYLGDDKTGLELKIRQQPDPTALFTTRSVFVSWVDYVPPSAPSSGTPAAPPQVLPGMTLATPIPPGSGAPSGATPRNALRGFATLTFDAVTLQISASFASGQLLPTEDQLGTILKSRLIIDVSKNTITWTGLQFNAAEERALVTLAANSAFGADFRTQVQSLLGAIESATPQFVTRSGFAEALFPCQWPATPSQTTAVFGSSTGRVDMGYTIRFGDLNPTFWSHDLLLNGWIEVNNLVSWPILQGNEVNPGNTSFTFPAARKPSAALSHLRHTARILLNQVEVADAVDKPKLRAGGAGDPLLVVADGFVFQFLTVVEHRFVEVTLAAGTSGASNPPPPTINALSNQRAWAVVQEVRLATPAVFAAFLEELTTLQTSHLGFTSGLLPVTFANLSYQRDEVRAPMAADLEALAADAQHARRALIVEASVPVCVNPDDPNDVIPLQSVPPETFAPLQYLPLGTQRGILSNLDDFSAGRTPIARASHWVYLPLPFLGRLQDPARDGTTTIDLPGAGESRLRLDPILHIYAQALASGGKPIDTLPLLLASWADNTASTLDFQTFDVVPGQSWPRLDPATLEESWFRVLSGALVSPPPPPPPGTSTVDAIPTAGSVLEGLPLDSPGRLSRSDALTALIDPNRQFYPPRLAPAAAAAAGVKGPGPSSSINFVWGQDALYVQQRVIDVVNRDPHAFALPGKRLIQFDRLARASSDAVRRHSAVTLLPPPLTPGLKVPPSFPHPVSFAVSPYLGVDYFDETPSLAKLPTDSDALFGELLALDRTGTRMIVVGTKLFVNTMTTDSTGATTIVHPSSGDLQSWALETYRRLAADSPFYVLRSRTVFQPTDNAAGLVIDYDFFVFRDTDRVVIPKKPPQAIRAELEQLRFAEGQRNRAEPPTRALAVELAPPQTRDVQPLRRVDEKPWGFSGIRLEISLAAGDVGTVGVDDARLWWQNCQHYVQFAPPLPDGKQPPLGGGTMAQQAGRLPKLFRARAIRALLPSVPDLVMPSIEDLSIEQIMLGSADAPLALDKAVTLQQSTLPGSLRCTVIAGRAGVPFAFRPHLRVQDIQSGTATDGVTPSYSCGAVPVQHRAPRPVPLPPNHLVSLPPSPSTAAAFRQDVALDAWGSWFDLGSPTDPQPAGELRTTIASAMPRDNAFFQPANGPLGLDIAWEQDPVPGLPSSSTTHEPPAGLPSTATSITLRTTPEGTGALTGWTLTAALVLSNGRFDLLTKTFTAADTSTTLPILLPNGVKAALGALPHGDPVRVDVTLGKDPAFTIKGYRQTLTLQSLVRRPDGIALPLRPVYALFEDPDYSRSLATPTVRGSKALRNDVDKKSVLVQLAADRHEYNPGTPIFLTFYTDDTTANEAQTFGRLVVYRRFGRDVSEALPIEGPFLAAPAGSIDVSAGFTLKLLPPAPDTSGLPTSGNSVIILVSVNGVLHFRVFDASGTRIVETDGNAFPNRQDAIKNLTDQYNELLTQASPSLQNQRSVITAIAAIVDVFWIEGAKVTQMTPTTVQPPPPFVWIAAGQIYRLHVENAIEPGDILEFQLDQVFVGTTPLVGNTVVADVTITDQPVTPPPQSGYALLRSDAASGAVSCVRFAWSPEAARIDLVNPGDLRTEIVRRRAVFRWTDVVRPFSTNATYAVQKLTAGGSTRAALGKFETVATS
jgi:hypothetical protein